MFSKNFALITLFSAPYHPQSNGKLEVFHKYFKPTLKKLCEKDPDNWDKYINQILASYHVTPHLATAETPTKDNKLHPPNLRFGDREYFKYKQPANGT